MAVAFDAVGPSSSGAISSSSTTLSWTHTVGSVSTPLIIVGVDVDATSDTGMTASVTCAGTAMTSLGKVESGATTQGFLQVFWLAGVATGANTIAVTVSGGTPGHIVGGSLSFSGAGGVGTPATANTGTGESVTLASNTSGNIIAGFIAASHAITATTSPSTSRFLNSTVGNAGFASGNIAGATSPATGSSVTMAWTAANAQFAAMAVEVLPPLAIDASSPVNVNQTSTTTAAATTASFTPPANSLLLVMWAGNSASATDNPATPTITDSLATHLTYTLVKLANPSSTGASVGGQAALWTAPVGSSPSAMTITVSNQAASGHREAGLKVMVLVGANSTSPIQSSGVGAVSTAATTFSQGYTPITGGTGGNCFLATTDWNNNVSTGPGAGSGTTAIASVEQTNVAYAFLRRTSFDDVAGTPNTLNGTLSTADTVLWAWADIAPALTGSGGGGTPVSSSDASGTTADGGEALAVTLSSADTGHGTDAGEALAVTLSSADTGHGTDAGEAITRAVSDTDTAHGTDGSGTVTASLSSTDTAHGTDTGAVLAGIPKSDSDASQAAVDGGELINGAIPVLSSDTAHGEDSGFHAVLDTDTGQGSDAIAGVGPVSSDKSVAVDFSNSYWLGDADAASALENSNRPSPVLGADTGQGADAGEALHISDTGAYPGGDSCLMTDTYTPVIDVYTYEPAWMFGPGGGLMGLTWADSVTGEKHLVLPVQQVTGEVLKFARELSRSREVRFLYDSDFSRSEDENEPAFGVSVTVSPALSVSLEVF